MKPRVLHKQHILYIHQILQVLIVIQIPITHCLEYQKAKHLLDIMISLSFSPMLVHKLIVEMFLDEDSYDLIGGKPWKGNLGVLQTERVDNTEVKCAFYKNGKLGTTCNMQ